MKKQSKLLLITLSSLMLFSCAGGDISSSSSSSESSNKGGEFTSDVSSIPDKSDDTNPSISTKPSNYDAITEDVFNELRNSGLLIQGKVNWEFSGEVTDPTYGTTYDASEKISFTKFAGQSSATLNSEVRFSSTSDEADPDASYSFKVFRNEKGLLTKLYLGADNKVHEVIYTAEDTDEDGNKINVEVGYDRYFANPFKLIKYSDIRDNKDGTYSVTSYSASDFGIATMFFGETFEADVNKCLLTLESGIVHLDIQTARKIYEDDTSVYNWFTASMDIRLAENKDIDKPAPYEEDEEVKPLLNAFNEISNSLKEGGHGVTFSYSEYYQESEYRKDVTYMTPEGYVTESNAKGSVPSGIAKFDNGKNYYFEFRNNKIVKSGTSNTLHLPEYGLDSLSPYIFSKDGENTYSVKTRALGQYAAMVMFDNDHAGNIYGKFSYLGESIQGTTNLVLTLEGGHLKSITYNYLYAGRLIIGTCIISDLNDTELGYQFKTMQLGPVQPGYEKFVGDFYSYDYGTIGVENNRPKWDLRVYGDGQYAIKERGEIGELADPIPDNPTKSQGVLKGDTFTIVTPDGMELPLKYYPANSSFDLGYGGLTDRSFPVLYGETKNREHVFTFALDPYSVWNVDSGLIKNAGEYAK